MNFEEPLIRLHSKDNSYHGNLVHFHKDDPEENENEKMMKTDYPPTESLKWEKQIADVINSIDSAELEDECKDDEEQIALLKQNKATAKKFILSLFDYVTNYTKRIVDLELVKKSEENYYSQEDRLKDMENSDKARKAAHNALIAELNMVVRFIAHVFSKNISEEAIDQWNADLEARGKEVLNIKRIDLPEKIIFPDSLDLNNRKHVTAWAVGIMDSLSKIKERAS